MKSKRELQDYNNRLFSYPNYTWFSICKRKKNRQLINGLFIHNYSIKTKNAIQKKKNKINYCMLKLCSFFRLIIYYKSKLFNVKETENAFYVIRLTGLSILFISLFIHSNDLTRVRKTPCQPLILFLL